MSREAVAKFNMIEQQIRPWEVLDNRVLSTLQQLDRIDFVGDSYRGLAYADCQIPVNQQVRMLPPTVEGRMLQALVVEDSDSALVIGCANGYISACLAKLAQQVVAIDQDQILLEKAEQNIQQCSLNNVTFKQQSINQVETAPEYDVIAVTASLNSIPESLKLALKTGGRLFVVVGKSPAMQAMLITRVADKEWTTRSLFETDLPRLPG
ncbi:MAG: protein-L-isoaspartate O-methyltransferase [Pseudomonadota bacterium]